MCVSLSDNLPVATKFMVDKKYHYEHGYRLGFVKDHKVNLLTAYDFESP